jgi:hypothetical protein
MRTLIAYILIPLMDLLTGLCYAITFKRKDMTGPHIFNENEETKPSKGKDK